MTDYPIIFTGEHVRATQDGRKTPNHMKDET